MTDKTLIELISKLERQLAELRKELKPVRVKKYYSYKEASQILCVSVEGLKSRIKRGQMKKVCNGSKPLIESAEIERYLKSQNPELNNL